MFVFFSAEEPNAKRVKVNEETEFNLAEITEGSVTSVRLSSCSSYITHQTLIKVFIRQINLQQSINHLMKDTSH